MARYDDIDPQDIDPDTGRPYSNYSSPSLDTGFYDEEAEYDGDYDDEDEPCTNLGGHSWVVRDDCEEISYCEHCGADGNA